MIRVVPLVLVLLVCTDGLIQTSYPLSSSDDMEQDGSGDTDNGSSDYEFGSDSGTNWVCIHFENIAIARGTPIISANIRFNADGSDSSGTVDNDIWLENVGNAPALSSGSGNRISGKSKTAAVRWQIDYSWDSGEKYYTPELKTIVNQVISRGDWNSGNSINFITVRRSSGNWARRRGSSVEGSQTIDERALLSIEYPPPPTSLSVVGVIPSVLGAGSTPVVRIVSGDGSAQAGYIGFTTTDCGGTILSSSFFDDIDSVTLSTLPSAGVYKICVRVSVVNGWVDQVSTSAKITVVGASSSTITSMFPTTIGVGSLDYFTFNIPAVTPTTRIGFGTSNCGSMAATFDFSVGGAKQLSPGISVENTYDVCYTVATNQWVKQDGLALRVRGRTISEIVPSVIGARTQPTMQFVGAQRTDTGTYVSFSSDGCASVVGTTFYDLYSPGPLLLGQPIATGDTYTTCVRFGSGAAQSVSASLVVTDSTTTAITVSPRVFTVSATPLLTVSSELTLTPTTQLSITRGACGSTNVWPMKTSREIQVTSAQLTTSGTHKICYSVDGGSTWTEQSGTVAVLVDAAPGALSAVTIPQMKIGDGVSVTVSMTGGQRRSTSRIGFAENGMCASEVSHYANFVYDSLTESGVTFTMPDPKIHSTVQVYPCYSVNSGESYVQQTLSPILVVAATPTSLTSADPKQHLVEQPVTSTFVGLTALSTARVGVVAIGSDCSAATLITSYPTDTGGLMTLSGVLSVVQDYVVCYSVNSGSSWVPQAAFTFTATSDELSSIMLTLSPSPVATNAPTTFTVTHKDVATIVGITDNPVIDFALQGECGMATIMEEPIVREVVTTEIASVVFSRAGRYFLCFQQNVGERWAQQIVSGVWVEAIEATTSSINSITPNVVGVGTNVAVVLVGATGSALTFFGLTSTSDCSALVAKTQIATGSTATLDATALAPGLYELCYSINNVNFELQAAAATRVNVIAATSSSINGLSPTEVGANTLLPYTFTSLLPDAHVAFATVRVGFSTTGCSGTPESITELTDSSTLTAMIVAPPGGSTYTLCYAVGPTWVAQSATLDVFDASAGSITAIDPGLVGASTTPSITFEGARPSPTTYVAFTAAGSDCTSPAVHVGVTRVTSLTQALESPISPTSAATYQVCYCVNKGATDEGGEVWFHQTTPGVELNVAVATPTSLVTITPGILGVGVTSTFELTGPGATPIQTAKLAFAIDGVCDSSATRQVTTNLDTTGPWSMGSSFAFAGSFRLCYTVDGVTWVHQTTPDLQMVVVAAAEFSITSIVPPNAGVNAIPTVKFSGARPTANTKVKFTLSDCASGVSETDLTASDTAAVPAIGAAGLYTVCYSVDGVTFVPQTLVSFDVLDATTASVASLLPLYIGAGTTPSLTAGIAKLTPTSNIAFVLGAGSCTDGGARSVDNILASQTFVLGGQLVTGAYKVCYSVGSDWEEQTPILNVIDPTINDVVEVSPTRIGVGHRARMELSLAASTKLTPTSYFGFAPAGSSCVGVAIEGITRIPIGASVGEKFVLAEAITTPGVKDLCWSSNGRDFVPQVAVTPPVVIGATTTTVDTISPTLLEFGTGANLVVSGAEALSTAWLALVNEGASCDVASSRVFEQSYPTEASLSLGTAMPVGQFVVCYSVDDRATWFAQSGVVLTVQDCASEDTCTSCTSSGVCTWCLEDNTCSVSGNCSSSFAERDEYATISPSNAAVCPTVSDVEFTDNAPTEGNTTVSLVFSTLAGYFPEGEYQIEWRFDPEPPVTTQAVWISQTELEIVTPPAPAGILALTYFVFNGATFFSDALLFSYYLCSEGTSCDTCRNSQRPLCGWCMESQQCTVASTCDFLWGGAGCPRINSLMPSLGPVLGGNPVNVNASFMLNTTAFELATYNMTGSSNFTGLQCSFGDQLVPASYLSPQEIVCAAPAHPKADTLTSSQPVPFSIFYQGTRYTASPVEYMYEVPAPIIVETTSPVTAIVVSLLACICCCTALAIAGLALYEMKKKRDKDMMPPPLTTVKKNEIVFGTKNTLNPDTKRLSPHLDELVEMLLDPSGHLLFAVSDATQSTETDMVSKAVVVMSEGKRGNAMVTIKLAVTREVEIAMSQSTMFRTNSFATKMFKTYSKMVGAQYLYDTLAAPLSRELAGEIKMINIKDESTEASLDTFALLGKCQVVFNAIVESEDRVPRQFRELFEHVRNCMQQKWPAQEDNLADLVALKLQASLHETRQAFNDGKESYNHVESMKAHISEDLDSLRGIVGPMQTTFSTFKDHVEFLAQKTNDMLEAFNVLEGALDPTSEQAALILAEHERAQNSIAVGGFFFLRFLVPALTAPEAYNLVKHLPSREQRKLLVLIGKVLQNLSNNQLFGRKEVSMEKLNEFISSNGKNVQKLFEKLSKPSSIAPMDGIDLDDKLVKSSVVDLYQHIKLNLPKVMAKLEAADEDVMMTKQKLDVAAQLQALVDRVEDEASGGSQRSVKAETPADVPETAALL